MSAATKKVSVRRNDAGAELKRFIGICADARKQFSPENFRENVGRAVGGFVDSMDEDSKGLVRDVVSIFRGNR